MASLATGKNAMPKISLFFFGADGDDVGPGEGCYDLFLESSRLADELGLEAIWVPERHFLRFGGLYGSPSVTAAALAVATKRIGIRAGSVVFPLQNPLRTAEEWSMIDNLSKGRVAIGAASGWHVNDFVLAPQHYGRRREVMYEHLDVVRRLWRGEPVSFPNGEGKPVDVTIRPKPIQAELPVWITAVSEGSFQRAGEMGFNILTSNFALEYKASTFGERVAVYRDAIRKHHGRDGHVTLMVHTFLADSADAIDRIARPAMAKYVDSNIEMKTVNTFGAPGVSMADRFASLDKRAREVMLQMTVNTNFEAELSFVGTAEACAERARYLGGLGADELACLIDFGIPVRETLESVRRLARIAGAGE
jgi:natural product biosynthesis luciferase-like monooxygenase protein